MIKRIIASLIFVSLLMAISIKLIGVVNGIDITHVDIGGPFLSFLKMTSAELESFKIEIPDIPTIPAIAESGAGWDILQVLVNFVNGFINVLNFIILAINTIIQLLQFVFLLVKNFITFRDTLIPPVS